MSLDNVPDSLRATFAQVRSVLAAPPYDGVYTALTFDPSVPPNGRVVVHLTQPDPRAIAEVQSAFVGGPDVVVEPSAYSLASCRSTWTTVAADPQVSSQAVVGRHPRLRRERPGRGTRDAGRAAGDGRPPQGLRGLGLRRRRLTDWPACSSSSR